MTPVGAYLKKLLYQYDCVVVPELGGFLTHYQSASFVAEKGQFLPPRKRLAFNEALRLDDGILVNYITLHESLPREEVVRMVSEFVNDLKQHVQLAGSFSVDGIGLFTPNAEGRLQFDPELRHNFFGESFGMTPVQAEKVSAVPIESVEAEEVTPIYALGPVRREEILEEGPFIRASRPLLRWAAAAVLVGSLGAVSYFTVIEPGQPMESSLNPANWFRIPTWLSANANRETKPVREIAMATPAKRPAPVAPATTVPTPVAPAVVPTNEGPSLPTTPVATPAPVVAIPVVAPATKVVVVPAKPVVNKVKVALAKPSAVANPFVGDVTPESAPETAAPKAEVNVATGPLFTVIAGSFASKPNAVRFRKTLQKAGYTDAYIIQPTRAGGLYKVAAVGSTVREEAVASTDSLKKLTGVTPFIVKN